MNEENEIASLFVIYTEYRTFSYDDVNPMFSLEEQNPLKKKSIGGD